MSRWIRRTLFLAFCTLICGSCACSTSDSSESNVPVTPPAPPKKTVRVATFNVHNLFDTICDSGNCTPSDYEKQLSSEDYSEKVANVVNGIWKINADVVLLQEIEKESCLKDIQTSLSASIYPGAVFGDIGRVASVNVGILTRGKVTNVRTHRENNYLQQPDGSQKLMSRELLEVEITLDNDIEMTAFTTHFVSKVSDSEGGRRLAEARFTHDVLADYIAAHPNRLIVFGGDLNDTPGSAPIDALESDGVLLRTTRNMPDEEIYTWGHQAAFDHLYYPAAFEDNFKFSMVYCDSVYHNGYSSSDHCALRSDFEF